MNSKCGLRAGLWSVALLACIGVFDKVVPVLAAPAQHTQEIVEVRLLPSTERAYPDGGDEERTRDGKVRDDIVPLESAEERGKFLTTLLMLDDLQEGKAGTKTKISHPEQLQSDEEVMEEIFKVYQNQAYSGKPYLKIPPKLMKKMRGKLKELTSD